MLFFPARERTVVLLFNSASVSTATARIVSRKQYGCFGVC